MISVKMTSNASIGDQDFESGREYLVGFETYELIKDCCDKTSVVVRTLDEIKSVLIVKSNGLGNVLNITPVVKKLSLLNPRMAIDIFCLPAYRSIFEAMSMVRKVYDEVSFSKADKMQWDLVIQGLPADFALTGIPNDRIISGENKWLREMHEVEANIKILRDVSDNLEYIPDTFVTIPPEVNEKIDGILPAGKKYLGINPGYTKTKEYWKIKHWGDEHYAEFLKLARVEYPSLTPVIVGVAGEDSFAQPLPDRVISVAGKLTILETAEVLRRCEFVITNDSGNGHLAGAVGTPTYVIFGPTSEVKNHPWKKSTVIKRGLKCRPCQFTDRWLKCHKLDCMDIPASEVMDTIKARKGKELAVVINSYNRYGMIIAFLNNIISWRELRDIRLIIIDDHSDDLRIDKAVADFKGPFEAMGNELVYIKHEYNYGKYNFANSIQEGIDAAAGCEHIMFTSEDVISNLDILARVREAYQLFKTDVQCVNFFIDKRIYFNKGKGIYASLGACDDGRDYVKWNDGFLALYRTSLLADIKIYGSPSDMGSGVWFCVNKFIEHAGLRQVRSRCSYAEHIGNYKSTMNNEWRKENPIEAVNLNLWK